MTRLPRGRRAGRRLRARRPTLFGEAELGQLMGVIIAINAWNRVGVGTALQPEALGMSTDDRSWHTASFPELRAARRG